jgi:hypothetical protein
MLGARSTSSLLLNVLGTRLASSAWLERKVLITSPPVGGCHVDRSARGRWTQWIQAANCRPTCWESRLPTGSAASRRRFDKKRTAGQLFGRLCALGRRSV